MGVNQPISVFLRDSDGETSTASCNITPGSAPIVPGVPATPSVSLTKGGRCNLSWDIQGMPEGTTCKLTGLGVSQVISLIAGSGTGSLNLSAGLTSNQKYVISCNYTEVGVAKTLSDSTICRIDSEVEER